MKQILIIIIKIILRGIQAKYTFCVRSIVVGTREVYITTVSTLILTPVVFVGLHLVEANVRESTNYRIESDSINIGGGLSTSTSYGLESTAGEIATGESGSASFNLRAGYQQMHAVYIALGGATAVTMTPSIPGVSGGFANGSTTVAVTTDSAAGYALTIHSSQSPAMQKGADSIADYVPSGDADFAFITNAADAHFGYSPSGVDIVTKFIDNGIACGVAGEDTPLACWDGLPTSDETIAQSSSPNHPNGATTTVYFRVGVGGSVLQAPGVYIATTTLTALPL